MSAAHAHRKTLPELALAAVMLAALFAIAVLGARLTDAGAIGAVAVVGFLLLAGKLTSTVFDRAGLPHLTAYILAGVVAGPHVLHVVDHEAIESVRSVNTLALALIALAGGAELELATVRRLARSLVWSNLLQTVLVLVAASIAFAAASPFISFAKELPPAPLIGAALLWGVLAVTRSPAAALGILAQTRAHGPLASFSLAFIMTSDILVVLVLAAGMTVARTLLDPAAALSLDAFRVLGHEMLGSIAIGTTLGLVLIAYVKLIGRQLLLVIVLLGFGFSEVLRYLHFEEILTFMVAGFVVRNLSKEGGVLLHEVEKLGGLVFVLFFAIAGAHLDLPMVARMWPAAIGLGVVRLVTTWGASKLSHRLAKDEPVVEKWGWAGLVSQAGLALGVAAIIERNFPQLGTGFRSLAVATVALHEMVGPVLFKLALDRAGETRRP